MPWLLAGLLDGEPPGAYTWVEDYEPKAGEILVDEDPTDKVWDMSLGVLRERTPAEATAFIEARTSIELDKAKQQKRLEIQKAGIAELATKVHPVTGKRLFLEGSEGNMELLAVCAATLAALVPPEQLDPRIAATADVFSRAQARADEIDAATTLDEVEGCVWLEGT